MTANPLLSQSDYEAIEAAVMETARGRWFVAEFARRNRQADTTMLLAALERIEAAVRGEGSVQSIDHIRFDLVEMAKAISRTKAEIALIKPDAERHGKFAEAGQELDSVVMATEQATSDILAAAEQIQEIAWTLRERGIDPKVCDLIDAKATDVYTACSFQDLTGQRTRKVIQVLTYLEARIHAMIDIWGLDGAMGAKSVEPAPARASEAPPLSGPARPGDGLDQRDVDRVMGSAVAMGTNGFEPSGGEPQAAPRWREAHGQDAPATIEPLAPPAASAPAGAPAAASANESTAGLALSKSETEAFLAMPRIGLSAMAQAMVAPSDPLAAVNALSYEEKVALFS
jgi:chemotaxis regulatin CheY-phosphate phosphatase CheZ